MDPLYSASPTRPRGLVAPGNIDLNTRPRAYQPDGSISTVRSMNFGTDQGEVLVPTIRDDGSDMTPDEAAAEHFASGRHLGIFGSPADAETYANELHLQQERALKQPTLGSPGIRTPRGLAAVWA